MTIIENRPRRDRTSLSRRLIATRLTEMVASQRIGHALSRQRDVTTHALRGGRSRRHAGRRDTDGGGTPSTAGRREPDIGDLELAWRAA